MRSSLSITPTPFRSSHLTLPTSPFTPQIPITPPPRPQTKPPGPRFDLTVPPPPQQPLKWLWQCHCCSRIYHLGTTRRCLDDGHYFCAGAPVTKRDRKTGLKVTRKSRACASEFDYQGWKTWGTWRRDVEQQRAAAEALAAFEIAVESDEDLKIEDVDAVPKPLFSAGVPQEAQWLNGGWAKKPAVGETPRGFWEKDCWNGCDYPSECRWGKQFGQQQSQAQTQAPVATVPSTPPPPPSMVAEPVAKDLQQPGKTFETLTSLPATIEEASEADVTDPSAHIHEEPATTVQETTKMATFDDLLASAKRRKRRSTDPPPSPLAMNPPSPTEQDGSQPAPTHSLQKAFDDFELDVKKSIGRASVLLTGFVYGLKSSGATDDEKAEAFVKGVKAGRKEKKRAVVAEEEGQSLSD